MISKILSDFGDRKPQIKSLYNFQAKFKHIMNKKLIYYKYRLILLLGTFIASFGFLAKTHAQDLGKTEKFPQWGYYTVRRDFRKCASPICGGFFIKQNNLKATPCPLVRT